MDYPPVSVVIPARNEERHLAESVRHVLGQDYPGQLEVVLAVGPSADRTGQIARELAAAEPRITVIANPGGKIPAALNAARRAARYAVIARVDGHALLPPGYLRTAVGTLLATGAADVGGVMAAEGVTPFQQAVAWAMTSRAGVGSAAFHTGGEAGPADSVYLGVYQRQAIEQAGGYDEEMLRAEDWELNYRIRARGGLIWFTPELCVTYRPRASVRALGTQYFHYGRWRRVIMREYPETASFRYLAPPVVTGLVATGLAAGLAGLAGIAAGAPVAVCWLAAGLVIPGTYLAGICAVTATGSRGVPVGVRARLPLVLGVMHMCWGTGFLTSPRGLHRPPGRGTRVRSVQEGARARRAGQPGPDAGPSGLAAGQRAGRGRQRALCKNRLESAGLPGLRERPGSGIQNRLSEHGPFWGPVRAARERYPGPASEYGPIRPVRAAGARLRRGPAWEPG